MSEFWSDRRRNIADNPIGRNGCADDCTHPSHHHAGVRPLILGLVAPSGGGKTTVCDHLTKAHGFVRIHVAEPIKRAFQCMFGVGPEYCERPLVEWPADFLGGRTPRSVLEHLGTELHNIAPQAIPLAARDTIRRIIQSAPLWQSAEGVISARVIVDGIRRTTEADMVRALGGKIVRMEGRPVDPNKPCDLAQAEVAADFVLHFTDHLDALRLEIDEVVEAMTGRHEPRNGRPGRRADDVARCPTVISLRDLQDPPALAGLIKLAREAVERMTPEEREAMHKAQAASWARGNGFD